MLIKLPKDITNTHFTELTVGWFTGKLLLRDNLIRIEMSGNHPEDRMQALLLGIEKEGFAFHFYYDEIHPESAIRLGLCPVVKSHGFSCPISLTWERYRKDSIIYQSQFLPLASARFYVKTKLTHIAGNTYECRFLRAGFFYWALDGHLWDNMTPAARICYRETIPSYQCTENGVEPYLRFITDVPIEKTDADILLIHLDFVYLADKKTLLQNLKKSAFKTWELERWISRETQILLQEPEEHKDTERRVVLDNLTAKHASLVKARNSLRDEIPEKDWKRLHRRGFLTITSKTKKQYVISRGATIVYTPDDGKFFTICVHTDTTIPMDHYINIKTLIDIDEDLLWKEGNVAEFDPKKELKTNTVVPKNVFAIYKEAEKKLEKWLTEELWAGRIIYP